MRYVVLSCCFVADLCNLVCFLVEVVLVNSWVAVTIVGMYLGVLIVLIWVLSFPLACADLYHWVDLGCFECLGTLVPNGTSDVGLSLVPCLPSGLVVLTCVNLLLVTFGLFAGMFCLDL
jgi:hypothetical protein